MLCSYVRFKKSLRNLYWVGCYNKNQQWLIVFISVHGSRSSSYFSFQMLGTLKLITHNYMNIKFSMCSLKACIFTKFESLLKHYHSLLIAHVLTSLNSPHTTW